MLTSLADFADDYLTQISQISQIFLSHRLLTSLTDSADDFSYRSQISQISRIFLSHRFRGFWGRGGVSLTDLTDFADFFISQIVLSG